MVQRFLALALVLLLSACVSRPAPVADVPRFKAVSFSRLPAWENDDFLAAKPALMASCKRLMALPDDRSLGGSGRMGTAGAFKPFCAALPQAQTATALRRVIETYLRPWAVEGRASGAEGLFTGYYEAALHGSRRCGGRYTTPLYRRPPEYVKGGMYQPRAAIVAGALKGRGLELICVDNAVDAFFVQVQGSGRVDMDDGSVMRIGYDGQNGYSYTPIGRVLVERGELSKETVSMQSIRAWLDAHPAEAQALMNQNESYVFFKEMPAQTNPLGGAQVPLTAGRSVAIDTKNIGYHVPLWLNTETASGVGINRLVVAQDTGGAIKGVVRGDLFWGYGEEAAYEAGHMQSRGRYFALLPKGVVPQ